MEPVNTGQTALMPKSWSSPPDMVIDPEKRYTAEMDTSMGTMTIALDPIAAPKTVNNFVFLAREGFYDGVIFHRVIQGFVAQGGDPEGSVAMANSGPDTNGSQFFIVTSKKGAETLVQAVGGEAKYSLFASVTEGMDIVKKIEADGAEGSDGKPAVVHKIVKVTIET